MRFYTPIECEDWCRSRTVPLDDQQHPLRELAFPHRLECSFPTSFTKIFSFSQCIESSLQPRAECLFWVTGAEIWPTSENYHLYYRLRQSYGNVRLLHEAPGHLCLNYERSDLVTLIYLSILFGWDAHLIPTVGYGRAFISHDERLTMGFDDLSQCVKTRQAIEHAKLDVSASSITPNAA